MTPTERVMTFRPDADIAAGMAALRERDGIGYSEQIRRALRAWLQSKGVMESARKRERPRKRA